MEVEELRIGNWIELPKGRIVRADPNIMAWAWSRGEKYRLKPIPLTPEILEKAGFERNRSNEFIKSWEPDRHLSISIYSTGVYPIIIQDSEFASGEAQVVGLNQVHYLHQLQNLYFALTGQELDIQL